MTRQTGGMRLSFLSGNKFGKMGLGPIALAVTIGFCFLFLTIHIVFGVWFQEPIYGILEETGNILGVTADLGGTANNFFAGCWNFFTADWDGDDHHGEFWKELFS